MGYGGYDSDARATRALTKGYHTKRREELFSRVMDDSMNPRNIRLRECCYSEDHPNAVPIVLSLDHTGSMGQTPHALVKDGLPTFMTRLLERGIDASVLFMAVGDHKSDRAPIQIGQFEANDEALDMWLTKCYLEGNGGGNGGESYFLPWHFCANHVTADAFNKGRKGFLFTVGDEAIHKSISANALKSIYGADYDSEGDLTAEQMLEAVSKNFNVFHVHLNHGWRDGVPGCWKGLLGENVLVANGHDEVPNVIANKVAEFSESLPAIEAIKNEKPTEKESSKKDVIEIL